MSVFSVSESRSPSPNSSLREGDSSSNGGSTACPSHGDTGSCELEAGEEADDEDMDCDDVDDVGPQVMRRERLGGKDSPTPDRESLHIDESELMSQNMMSTSKCVCGYSRTSIK